MIAPALFLAVCVAGGVGSAVRFFVDGLVKSRVSLTYPLPTTIINVTGSLVLGILTGASAAGGLPSQWLLVFGGGLIGGYTTFSTASVETVRLAQQGRYVSALVNGMGMLVVATAAAGLGLWVGSAM